jgi:hypothetical protein
VPFSPITSRPGGASVICRNGAVPLLQLRGCSYSSQPRPTLVTPPNLILYTTESSHARYQSFSLFVYYSHSQLVQPPPFSPSSVRAVLGQEYTARLGSAHRPWYVRDRQLRSAQPQLNCIIIIISRHINMDSTTTRRQSLTLPLSYPTTEELVASTLHPTHFPSRRTNPSNIHIHMPSRVRIPSTDVRRFHSTSIGSLIPNTIPPQTRTLR